MEGPNDVEASGSPAVPETERVRSPRMRRGRAYLLLGVVAIILLTVVVAASRYQPLAMTSGAAIWGPLSSSDQVNMSLETTLSNAGHLGVTVLALRPTVAADPPVVVEPLMPCFHYVGHSRECSQDKRGLLTGDVFHSFPLAQGSSIPVAWQYSFSCRPLAGGSSISGPVEVRVTYRFLWFTHTELQVLANTGTSVSRPEGPCPITGTR
jgi:hypothetical protein